MTDSTNDWADEIVESIRKPGFGGGDYWFREDIAKALRSAELRGRTMGVRLAEDECFKVSAQYDTMSPEWELATGIYKAIRNAADKLTGEGG